MSDKQTAEMIKPLETNSSGETKITDAKATAVSATVTPETTTPKADVKKVEPPKRKGFSNPALRAMGIPELRLPSRNWSIFWIVVGVGLGGIAYDRYEQTKIRAKWCERVAKYGQEKLDSTEKARKITVYVAPPPNSFLSDSMSVFKKYIKPVLNSAGVDFEIKSENRQGVIRSTVAAEIRELRRDILKTEQELQKTQESKTWYQRSKNYLFSYFKKVDKEAQEKELHEKLKSELKDLRNIIGVFYKNPELKDTPSIYQDSEIIEPSSNGGVICLGRGAYKEYLHGLHEGLLGPLDKPLEDESASTNGKDTDKKSDNKIEEVKLPVVQSLDSVQNGTTNESTEGAKQPTETEFTESTEPTQPQDQQEQQESAEENREEEQPKEEEEETKKEEELDENGEKPLPIPKPFISSEDYKTAKFAPEFTEYLQNGAKVPTKTNVAPIFQQPILVFPVYNVVGFTQIPKNIYRYYTKRYYMEEYGKATVALIENLKSKFKLEDVDLCKAEENDWPNKWIEKGKKNNSEWVQELVTDERVLSKLWVYDADRVK